MHDIDLILTLTAGLSAALVLGYLTQWLRLSPIVGYLLAGIVVGPHSPGFVADRHLAEQMAELGVILLMFGVGLHFHLRELLDVKGVAIPGAVVQSGVATLLGMLAGRLLGWTWATGLIFGGAVSVASTVVLVRVLSDNRDLHTRTGHIAVGWLVVEDLITVLALVMLPVVLDEGRGADGAATTSQLVAMLAFALLKISALVAIALVVGGRLVPWLLERVAATRSRELFTLAVLVIAFGIAVGSSQLFGVSMALGAFLAGMVVGRSEFSLRAASEALPMRDAFAVLFFVSVGMIFDPWTLLQAPGALAAALAIVLVAKPLAALVIVLALRHPPRVALPVAIALAQIGEFSFILAALGRQLGAMPDLVVDTLVATAIVSITLNPLLYRLADPLTRMLDGFGREGDAPDEPVEESRSHRAVIVGYGPVGQTVAQLLLDNEIEPTVIELNLDTVRRLKAFGVRAIYGDASRPDILREAGIAGAQHLILTSASGGIDEEIVRRAKEIDPAVHILARSQYVRQMPKLRRAGAEDVYSAEGEVALAFTARILERLGATADQLDRERARVEATFRDG
jgi:CPA2 family monovalent cation:H+ antiporter-2